MFTGSRCDLTGKIAEDIYFGKGFVQIAEGSMAQQT